MHIIIYSVTLNTDLCYSSRTLFGIVELTQLIWFHCIYEKASEEAESSTLQLMQTKKFRNSGGVSSSCLCKGLFDIFTVSSG